MNSSLSEFRRGWQVLVGGAVGLGCGAVSLTIWSLGPFVEPLSREFGWSRAAITAAIMAKSFGIPIAGIFAGHLADRFGSRRVALVSQLLLAMAVSCLALVSDQIWTLYLGYVAVVVLGAGTLHMIWARSVVGWFDANRGTALALTVMGLGLGGALIPSYVTWLMTGFGWRGAYLGLAALPLFIGFPVTLIFFRDPPAVSAVDGKREEKAAAVAAADTLPEGKTLKEALKTKHFWWLGFAFMFGVLAVQGLLINIFPLLTDRGIDRGTAAMVTGLFGIAGLAGRLISGALLDFFKGKSLVLSGFFLAGAGACLALLVAGDNVLLCAVSVFMVGIALGAEGEGVGYLAVKFFGRRHFGVIYATLYTFLAVGMGFGPVLMSWVYDHMGNYDLALIGGSVSLAVAAVLLLALRDQRSPVVTETGPVRPSAAGMMR